MKKIFFIFLFSLVVASFFYVVHAKTGFLSLKNDRQLIKLSLRQNFFAKEQKELLVELVKTPASTSQGLSDRQTLVSSTGEAIDGMLFVFEQEQFLTFWMKDMLFDLDICWIKQRQFLACARAAKAPLENETPDRFTSPDSVSLVLETLPEFLTEEDLQLKLFFK